MCGTCGCGGEGARIDGDPHHHHHEHAHDHDHHDGHDHHHDHDHPHDHDHHHHHDHDDAVGSRLIRLETDLLAKNNALAAANRERFRASNILALNLLSSPGSGKTSLLVRTLEALGGEFAAAVIEGDQQTDLDADRIRKTGVPAVQINTGKGCHLDAHMVGHAVDHLSPADGSVLFIENVGNLVCPAAFDLGEAFRVVILSVTEGDDKPLKYPDMFAAADLVLINKIDLLAHVDFDMDKAIAAARRVNPRVRALPVSARTGEGIEGWINWIRGARMMAG